LHRRFEVIQNKTWVTVMISSAPTPDKNVPRQVFPDKMSLDKKSPDKNPRIKYVYNEEMKIG